MQRGLSFSSALFISFDFCCFSSNIRGTTKNSHLLLLRITPNYNLFISQLCLRFTEL
ncbi:uncharacterized protein ASCRUDRAFT_153465 [Ascoidea rubescens DSM 1968]|uniref:Uncharacterized protein n=1 Tax=Ascoidea rubescens DSM 1968 TaxID=1344418 RepID=A0A1D2VFP4_9ASCO|nr:hypothetical protein ASCRUDRAFT_153465 [Ascoidea rubescens DSM 1968]ODV60340.1 hypothetical protein ASCRUDRAFT_153465 [Ascoidea rubescens DSM 1968]